MKRNSERRIRAPFYSPTGRPSIPPEFYAYPTNYLIDLHAGIIVDVEATPAFRSQEVESTKTMVNRVEQRFHLKPQRLVGDTAYGTGARDPRGDSQHAGFLENHVTIKVD
ncbi:hypothetical protein HDG41_007598 [Paraburkholderia sp. JPY162]|uniref:Transposase IS4-like domain-containing protein n=1 Tax=Paraburkholderia youngii TaxID=2782701 RepID=A0A7W8LEH7_9BURK|nr:hypothetical protein [Paraburkholderia youngii]